MRNLLALAALALAAAAHAQTAPDARLLAAAERAQPAFVQTLTSLVAIESGSMDLGGLARMADTIEGRLKAIGFAAERRKAVAGPGADIVVATREGRGRARIMLLAHMDTVYSSGVLQSQPIRTEGSRFHGPGAADDKGGIALILHALEILRDIGWSNFARITVVVNPDEEIGSVGSGELIAELGAQHDVVLSFEPTAARAVAQVESLLLGAAGTAAGLLEVKGRASHAGAAPDQGRNALVELAHRLLATRDAAQGIPGAQLNWTNATANQASNQIPDRATARADIRITVPGAERALEASVRAKLAAPPLVPDTETKFELRVGRPAFLADERGKALAEQAQAISREIGRELRLVPMTGGGTDAGYAARSGKPAVVESFGMPGWGYHARDEYVDLDAVVPRLYLATRLMMEIGRR
jgi:glutamate carboxypeptidase